MFTHSNLEVVRVPSHEKQQDLLALLRDMVSVTALGSDSGADHFVVFDCPDRRLKFAIDVLCAEVDPASAPTFAYRRSLLPRRGGGRF